MLIARQSTALETAIGPVLDADGVAVTDCVVADFKIKKTTGNFAALNGSATLTHVSAGVYDLVLTTSDLDTVGLSAVAIDDTVNACPLLYLQVVEEAVYDATFAASAPGYVANAPVNVAQFGGTNGTFNGGRPETNLSHWLGTAPLALSSQQVQAVVPATQKVDVETIKTRAVSAAGAVAVGAFVGQDTAAIGVNASGHVSRVTTADAVTLVNGLAANVLTAAALAADAASEIAGAIEQALINEGDGNAVLEAIRLKIEESDDDLTAGAIAVAVRDAILDRVLAGNHDTNGTPGKLLQDVQGDTNDIQSRIPDSLTVDGLLKVDALRWAGTPTATSKSGYPAVDALAISGDTAAADNAEAAFDGTGYNVGGGQVVVTDAANIAAIKLKTDLIPAAPASTTNITAGTLTTVGTATNVTTVNGLAAGVITEASIATPAETAGRPTGILGMMRRMFEWGSNKRARNRTTGDVVLRNAADSATLETQTQSSVTVGSDTTDTQSKGQ